MLWLIIGIVIGLGLAYVAAGARSGKLGVRWYQWLLGLTAVILLLLAIQNYMALQNEMEYRMATFALVAFGLPGAVAATLIWVIPMLKGGRRAAKVPQSRVETA